MKRFMTPDEYLEELEKKLNGKIENYVVKGFYHFQGRDNNFSGLFEIDENGAIAGYIRDPNSICKRHIVKGNLSYQEKFRMDFVKIPPNFFLLNIYYLLLKEDGTPGAEGKYKGSWEFREEALKLDTLENETETKNRTQITLSKV